MDSIKEKFREPALTTPNTVRKILVLAASPEDQVRLNLEKEVKEIASSLRQGEHRDQFVLEQRWAVNRGELQDALLYIKPEIVHFCGHGAAQNGLVLQDDNRKTQLVSSEALTKLFDLMTRHVSPPVKCVVLNACSSQVQADEISKHVDYVLGMKQEIGDKAAIQFAKGFYRALSTGLSYRAAFEFGCNAINLENIPEHLTPILQGKAVSQ
jgi:CHAT domain-containing protein